MRALITIILIFSSYLASADALLQSIEIASNGAEVQAERIKLVAQNIANQSTVGIEPGSDPYKRRLLFIQNQYDRKLKTHVVKVKKYGESDRFIQKYDPFHPAADNRGIVKLPGIEEETERLDSIEGKTLYEANLAVMEMSKGMLTKTIDIMK